MAIGLGAGIIFATIAVTVARYRDLPETIPIHFGLDGRPNGYGPRNTIWLVPAVQLLLTASALSFGVQTTRASLTFWLDLLVLCLAVQLLIIAAATSVSQRLNRPVFWSVFVATMAFAVVAALR
jgi:Protein of unknown function (DUF1648)